MLVCSTISLQIDTRPDNRVQMRPWESSKWANLRIGSPFIDVAAQSVLLGSSTFDIFVMSRIQRTNDGHVCHSFFQSGLFGPTGGHISLLSWDYGKRCKTIDECRMMHVCFTGVSHTIIGGSLQQYVESALSSSSVSRLSSLVTCCAALKEQPPHQYTISGTWARAFRFPLQTPSERSAQGTSNQLGGKFGQHQNPRRYVPGALYNQIQLGPVYYVI